MKPDHPSSVDVPSGEPPERSEARRVDADLATSRARLRAVLDSLHEGVFVCDTDGRVVDTNPAALAHLGIGVAERAHRPLDEFAERFELRDLDGGLVPVADWPLNRLLRGESLSGLELALHRRGDGAVRFVRYNGSPVRDAQGRVDFAVLAVEDISERKRNEQALHESERRLTRALDRLRLVTQVGGVGTWYHDIADGSLVVDEAYAAMLGETVERFGRDIGAFDRRLHPDDAGPFWSHVGQHLRGERDAIAFELRLRHADGHWVRIASNGRITARDRAGGAAALAGVHRDVSGEWQLRQSTRDAIESLENVTRGARIATWRWYPQTGELEVNDRWFEQFGLRRGDMPARFECWVAIAHPDDWAAARPGVEAHLRGETEGIAFEARVRRPDGHWAWIRTQGRVVRRDAQGAPELVAGIDLETTQAREAADQLRLAREAAERATQAKSAFLASMSHEIRTPLNGVIGATSLLADSPLDDGQRELVEMQRDAGLALLTVIDDILDISKIEAGRLELDPHPFDLARLVRRTVDMARPQAEAKGLAIAVDIPPGLERTVVGDATRIRQVLLNMVSNAVKFTARGHIRVEVADVSDVADVAGGAGVAGGDAPAGVRFVVADTGIGIAPEMTERLFQPFAQAERGTTRQFGGTGLGLAICRELVALMQGRIGVDSVPGEGSTFWFELPLAPGAQAGNGAATAGRDEGPGTDPARPAARRLHVLLAEDVRINQVIATRVLENAGHRVTVVGDGLQAVEAVAQGDFDAVLMDVRMPELDGLDATRRIRALDGARGRIPIIGLTAEAIQEELDKCLASGMDATVTKPFEREALLGTLGRITARGAA